MEEDTTTKSDMRHVVESPVFGLSLALGAGVVFTVVAATIHDARLLLVVAWPCAITAVWEVARIYRWENTKAISFAGALIFGAMLFLLYVALSPEQFDNNESLPGFSGYIVINFQEQGEARRKFYFMASDPEGAVVALYQSKSDMFRLVVHDANEEVEVLDIPSGNNGIPLNRWMVLTFDIGVAADHSFMRLSLNGRPIGERSFPFRLEMGSRNWNAFRLGASPNGSDGGTFMQAEYARYPMTLTKQETTRIVLNARKRYSF